MNPAFTAIAWEIWARNKWKWAAALFLLVTCRLIYTRGDDLAVNMGYLATALAIFLVIGSYHFTEGNRKGGFGSFPTRFFTMPLQTQQLVWFPMALGTISVVTCYLLSVWGLLRPLGQNPPILWPCLYLSCGTASFQTILWAFPDRRYLKLLLLSLFATVLALGWMFFLPHLLEGTLQQFGFTGSPHRFQQGLTVTLILWTVGSYGVARLAVGAQRMGKERWWLGWRGFDLGMTTRWFRRKKAFSNASSALFWMEWHQSGKILPVAIVILMLVTFIPTYLTGPHNEQETIAATIWMLLTPILMASVIGLGASKPDFWKPELELPLFQSIKPMRAGDWVTAKIKVAAASVLAAWLIVFVSLFLWIAYLGDLSVFESLWMFFKGYQRTVADRVLFVILGTGVLIIMTFRLYLLSLPSGLSGSTPLYYTFNSVVVMLLFGSAILILRQANAPHSALELHQIWPMIAKLPWILAGLVSVKCFGVAWIWCRIRQDSIAADKSIRLMMGIWFFSTSWCMAFVFMAVAPGVHWLYYLLLALSVLVCPLLSPGLAMIVFSRNRSR